MKTWGQFEGEGYRVAAGAGEAVFDAQGNFAGGAGTVGKNNGAYGGLTKTMT